MAYNEQKGSLPPIIEDESDDNLMPMLYRKELGRSDSRTEERSQTGASANTGSPSTNGVQMPYNSWKSKHANFLKSPDTGRDSSDMLSKLGQKLETCPMLVSPQHKQASINGSQNYQGTLESSSYRQADSQYQNRPEGGGLSHLEEQGRYFVPFQENPDSKTFTTPTTLNSRGYFPEQRGIYQEHIYNPQNHLRTINAGYQNHENFKYSQGAERSFNHSNIASSPYGLANSTTSPYKPQHVTPHHFQSPMFRSEFNGTVPCQGSCCRNNHSVRPIAEMHSYQSEKTQSPHGSPAYNPEFSHRQSMNTSHKTSPCHCLNSTEMKNKKRESKQEKDRKRQITDLYRIVFLQNQQIMELQNQVKKLIELHEKYDDKLKRSDQDHTPKMSKGEKRMFNLSVIEENQNLMEKVSVGIMTSFIDTTTIKTKGNSKKGLHGNNGHRLSKSSESSSSATSETSTTSSSEDEEVDKYTKKSKLKKKKSSKAHEDSILLNGLEIQTVAENPRSPSPPSMHLEMQEFGASSSNTDDSDSSDDTDGNPVPVSWTFYDKVVGKVNNMLNKSESDDDSNEVRIKTLEQLRKLGINFVDQECSPSSKRVTFDSPYHQRPIAESDTSMRMNALAVKYLKEERISQETPEKPEKMKKIKKTKEKKTVEKHNPKKKSKSGHVSGKILDITAIKQQPKLLPKKM